jgi:hypothetical protein
MASPQIGEVTRGGNRESTSSWWTMAADIERRVALKMPTHRLMREGVEKRSKQVWRPSPICGRSYGWWHAIVGGGRHGWFYLNRLVEISQPNIAENLVDLGSKSKRFSAIFGCDIFSWRCVTSQTKYRMKYCYKKLLTERVWWVLVTCLTWHLTLDTWQISR